MPKLTRAKLNKAINDKLKTEFPSIYLESRDVTEGFKRPSFYVDLETIATETFSYSQRCEMTCRIRFFPTDRYEYKEEAYDVQDRLERLFGLHLAVGERVITLGEANTDIRDGVLYYDFHFLYYEDLRRAGEGEKMRELSFRG